MGNCLRKYRKKNVKNLGNLETDANLIDNKANKKNKNKDKEKNNAKEDKKGII
jgi:hypothetical protein